MQINHHLTKNDYKDIRKNTLQFVLNHPLTVAGMLALHLLVIVTLSRSAPAICFALIATILFLQAPVILAVHQQQSLSRLIANISAVKFSAAIICLLSFTTMTYGLTTATLTATAGPALPAPPEWLTLLTKTLSSFVLLPAAGHVCYLLYLVLFVRKVLNLRIIEVLEAINFNTDVNLALNILKCGFVLPLTGLFDLRLMAPAIFVFAGIHTMMVIFKMLNMDMKEKERKQVTHTVPHGTA